MGQLAGLKRRKLALEMLGAAVQAGLSSRSSETTMSTAEAGSKRQRNEVDATSDDTTEKRQDYPAAKRNKTDNP